MALLNVLIFAAIPALAVFAGGVLASVRPPSAAMRSAVQHFAAGVVFAALATELLPDVMHRRLPVQTIAGFASGVVVMLLLKAFTEKKLEGADPTKAVLPKTLLIALGVDIALDGLLIGVGFSAGEKQGLLLTIALTMEVLFLGVSASAALSGGGASRSMIALIAAGLGGLLLMGAGLGVVVLSDASGSTIDIVLSFGIAALLYLVVEELMVEAHEGSQSPLRCATFFLGFLVLMIVEMSI